jgi:hypothetical protein
MNNLILEPSRLQFFYNRIAKNNFDFSLLMKFVTSTGRSSVIENITTKVTGFSGDTKRSTNFENNNHRASTSLSHF